MKRREAGLATVEFALTGVVILLVLLGCIEIGRMLFVWNTVDESTRRGARMAAICPLNDAAITRAVLMGGDGESTVVTGLMAANVSVAYLNAAGGAAGSFSETAFASVSITGFQHTLILPVIGTTITVPPFTTTVPVESLGYIPESGARVCLES